MHECMHACTNALSQIKQAYIKPIILCVVYSSALLCDSILDIDSLWESVLDDYILPIILHIIQPCFACIF